MQCTPVKELRYTAYSAVNGIIYPLQYSNYTKNIAIIPYATAVDEYAKEMESEVVAYWRKDIPDEQVDGYVQRNWLMPDTFYIMTDYWNTTWYGCIAVDTRNGTPTLSHLYVRPGNRGRGLSKFLLMISEEYVETLGYTEARLFCKPDMVAFYQKNDYFIESTMNNGMIIMCKNVADKRSDTHQNHLSTQLYPPDLGDTSSAY